MADITAKLIEAGSRLLPTLNHFGPNCPCALVYMADDKTLPAMWGIGSDDHETGEPNPLRVDVKTLTTDDDKRCIVCMGEWQSEDADDLCPHPIRTPCCKHLIGEECARKWISADGFKGQCVLAEEGDMAPKLCPYCRQSLFWYPRDADGRCDWTVVARLQHIFDNITLDFANFAPAADAVVYIDPVLLTKIQQFLGPNEELAAKSGKSSLTGEKLCGVVLSAMLPLTLAHSGTKMPMAEFISRIDQRLDTIIARMDVNYSCAEFSASKSFLSAIIRFFTMKWWIGCHIAELDTTCFVDETRPNDADQRRASVFGETEPFNLPSLPALPGPFNSLADIDWLNSGIFQDSRYDLPAEHLTIPEQRTRDALVRDYREITREIHELRTDYHHLPAADLSSLTKRLLAIQATAQSLVPALGKPSVHDPVDGTLARPLHDQHSTGIEILSQSGERAVVSDLGFRQVFDRVAGRFQPDPAAVHARFQRLLAISAGRAFPRPAAVDDEQEAMLQDASVVGFRRMQRFLDAHFPAAPRVHVDGAMFEYADWTIAEHAGEHSTLQIVSVEMLNGVQVAEPVIFGEGPVFLVDILVPDLVEVDDPFYAGIVASRR